MTLCLCRFKFLRGVKIELAGNKECYYNYLLMEARGRTTKRTPKPTPQQIESYCERLFFRWGENSDDVDADARREAHFYRYWNAYIPRNVRLCVEDMYGVGARPNPSWSWKEQIQQIYLDAWKGWDLSKRLFNTEVGNDYHNALQIGIFSQVCLSQIPTHDENAIRTAIAHKLFDHLKSHPDLYGIEDETIKCTSLEHIKDALQGKAAVAWDKAQVILYIHSNGYTFKFEVIHNLSCNDLRQTCCMIDFTSFFFPSIKPIRTP